MRVFALKLLLIHPPPFKGRWLVRQGRCRASAVPNILMEFPIFLASVAAILREAGHSLVAVDAMADELSLSSIKDRIMRFAPDAIIAETAAATYQGDIRVADIAKQIDPMIHTIYYGWYATARPTDVLKHQNIDFVLRGEPEYTSLELINALENGGNLTDVKGLSFKNDSNVKHNPARPFIENLDELPNPARDLFPIDRYVAEPFGKITTVVANKGCPYHCIFCLSHLMDGNKLRSRNPKKVAEEIESVVDRFHIRTIFFYADTFTLWGDKNITQFCTELIRRKLDIRWLINSRVDTVPSERTLEFMAKSGCFLMQLGVESGSLKMIKAMRKGRNAEECENYMKTIKPGIRKIKEKGILTKINMVIGLRGENGETVKESVDLAKACRPDLGTKFQIATPFPGTILGKVAEREGLLLPDGKGSSPDPGMCYFEAGLQLFAKTNNCDPEMIVKLQKAANQIVKLSLGEKLRLAQKLLRITDQDVFLGTVRLAAKERTGLLDLRHF